jgi:uroporphyrinogen-III synthase
MSALEGKRVVVTRAEEQAAVLCELLEASGAVPIRCPTIVIAPPLVHDELDAALEELTGFAWVVFASMNGVRFFHERATARGRGAWFGSGRVAAVGGRTAGALEQLGVPVAFVPVEQRAAALGGTLPDVHGRSVLLVQGERSDPLLARELMGRGAKVTAVAAYRTIPTAPSGEGLEALREGADALTFTSPSTVDGFVALGPDWRGLARRAVVATIGPTTTTAALLRGLGVHAEASEPSMRALVDAVTSVCGTVRRANQELP